MTNDEARALLKRHGAAVHEAVSMLDLMGGADQAVALLTVIATHGAMIDAYARRLMGSRAATRLTDWREAQVPEEEP